MLGRSLIAAILLPLSTSATTPDPVSPPPNIVLILVDDLGYGDLGCYGSTVNATPHIDRLAREGRRFTDFYVADSVCSPSRAAILTGCYPERVGMDALVNQPGGARGLHPDEITLADMLSEAGYATACFGKWHQGDQSEFLPRNQGFDTFFGLPYSHDIAPPYADAGWIPEPGSLDAARDGRVMNTGWHVPALPLIRNESVVEQFPDPTSLTDRWTDAAIDFATRHQDQPFFIYLAHTDVHLPFFPSTEDRATSRNGLFGAALRRLDRSIGRIMNALEDLGLDRNTLVLFLSDNGTNSLNPGQSNAPLRGAKSTAWDGGHRVPFIAWWPDRIPGGSVESRLAASMDLFPTLAHLTGGRMLDDRIIDGVDIRSLWTDEQITSSPRETYYYYSRGNFRAVRWRNWKLYPRSHREKVAMTGTTHEDFPPALYDLNRDVGETTNVAGQYPEIVTRLTGLAEAAIADLGDHQTNVAGRGRRPVGQAAHARPLDSLGPVPTPAERARE